MKRLNTANGKKFNVCMLMTTFFPIAGGGQKQLLILSLKLQERGIGVSVLMRGGNGISYHRNVNGIDVYAMPIFFQGNRVISSLCYTLFSFIWLVRNRKKYDIIHCHQVYSPTTAGILAKMFLGKKVIVKVTASNEYGELKEIKSLPFFKFRKKILSKVDRFILINPQVKNELMGIGIKESRMQYIPNGVNTLNQSAFNRENKTFLRKKLNLAYNRIGIYVGRLSEEKSLETLLVAWKNNQKAFPDAHLLFLGEGGNFRNVEENLRNSVNELGLDGIVHCLGKKDNVFDYLLASDIFILPSISEGMSNALLEAMSAGLAVIASDIDANRHIIQDGVNGLLFECKDSDKLAGLIEKVFNSHDMAEKLGRQAQDSVLKNYSIDSVAKKYVLLYNELTS